MRQPLLSDYLPVRPSLVSDHFFKIQKFPKSNHYSWNLSWASATTSSAGGLKFSFFEPPVSDHLTHDPADLRTSNNWIMRQHTMSFVLLILLICKFNVLVRVNHSLSNIFGLRPWGVHQAVVLWHGKLRSGLIQLVALSIPLRPLTWPVVLKSV